MRNPLLHAMSSASTLRALRLIIGALVSVPPRGKTLGLMQFSRSTEATHGVLPPAVSEN
jgi:hypothetical protein